MVTTDPIFSERARAILMRWKQQTCTRSQALLNQWQEIIERKQWEIAVEDSERGRQLRQASPLACLLPHAVRFSIIRKVRALKEAASCEGFPFEEMFGYYAQGVDSSTCILPDGWRDRLVRLQSQNTDGKIGYCLDVTDLFLAKCAANREKDRIFNRALLQHGIVHADTAKSRIPLMPLDAAGKQRILDIMQRLENSLDKP